MQICLVFPPGWDPTQPYLSLPALKAFLKSAGHTISIHDLNVEFYDFLLSASGVAEAYSMTEEDDIVGNRRISLEETEILFSIRQPLIKEIEPSRAILRSDAFFTEDKRLRALRTIDLALQIQSLAFPEMQVTLQSMQFYGGRINNKILSRIIETERLTPFANWYRKGFLPSLQRQKPSLVGVSLVNYEQLIPTLILLKEAKEVLPSTHFVLGGDVATRLADTLVGHPVFSRLIDSVVCGEGEVALLTLADVLEEDSSKRNLFRVPNLCYADHGQVIRNKHASLLHMSRLPIPDFSGLPLEKYLSPHLVLPVESCRGCYWGKCTFCEEVGKPYRTKTATNVADEVEALARNFKNYYFAFTDDACSPKIVRAFSDEIRKRNLDIRWRVLLRAESAFDDAVCSSAYSGGCRMALVGVESGAPRIQQLIRKGITVSQAKRVLEALHRNGIWTHCFLMMGLPTETVEEVNETLDLLREGNEYIDSAGFSEFVACRDTPLSAQLTDLSVQVEDGHDDPWTLHYTRLRGNVLTPEQKRTLTKEFDQVLQSLGTCPEAWLQLHVNHLFLQVAVMGRDSLEQCANHAIREASVRELVDGVC